jgi:hypothetical protein
MHAGSREARLKQGMHRMRGANAAAWGWGLFREPSRPRDMQQHVLLRGRDARLFDAMVRDLRMRLYDGRPVVRGGLRFASLRQGPSPRLAAGLFALGCAGVLASVPGVSELGRSSLRLAWDGGVAHAAVPAATTAGPRPRTAPVALALAAAATGVLLASQDRKQMWLVGQPGGRTGEIDVWVAGAAHGRAARFEREFADFVARAEGLDATLRGARCGWHDEACAADRRDDAGACRGTGPAARP